MSAQSPYREIVVSEHRAYFDEVETRIRRLQASRGAAALGPTLWAAIATAVAESVQAHRALVEAGFEAARERLALAETLLAELTDAESAADILPSEFGTDTFQQTHVPGSASAKPN